LVIAAPGSLLPVTLLNALYAFSQEHERCGDLDSAVDGDHVWMVCSAAR